MLLVIGVVAALLLLAWGGYELDHLIHAYPGQSVAGVISFLIVAFALAAARYRKSAERVPLRPVTRELPPSAQAPPALKAVPVLRAVAAPYDEEARDCEGPGCSRKVNDDPWTARVEGDEASHVFCSESCASRWRDCRAPLSGPVGGAVGVPVGKHDAVVGDAGREPGPR
jgi:hypothetical protein